MALTFTPAGPWTDGQIVSASNGQRYRWVTAAKAFVPQSGPGNTPQAGLTVLANLSNADAPARAEPMSSLATALVGNAAAKATLKAQVGGGDTDAVDNRSSLPGSSATAAFDKVASVLGRTVMTLSPANPTRILAGIGVPRAFTRADTGGAAPFGYSLVSGTIPLGMALDGATGTIAGTPTGAPVTRGVVIRRRDADGLFVYINVAIETIVGLQYANAAAVLPNATVGTSYSFDSSVAGGLPSYAYSVSAGSLPAGLTLSATTGAISGVPTSTSASTFTVRVIDARSSILLVNRSLAVLGALSIGRSAGPLPVASTQLPYQFAFNATGGAAPYTYSVASGSLPPGLTLSAAGAVTGTATANGTSNFSITLSDADGRVVVTAFSIVAVTTIMAAIVPRGSEPKQTVGVTGSVNSAVSGGTNPVVYTVIGGALPPGMALDASTGVISGVPTAASTYTVYVRATDANNITLDAQRDIKVSAPLVLSPNFVSPVVFRIGQAYTLNLGISGGSTPYQVSLTTGVLPAGLTLSAAGIISGTVSGQGVSSAPFTVRVSDADGRLVNGSYSYSVPSLITLSPPAGELFNQAGQVYLRRDFTASGGVAPYTYALTYATGNQQNLPDFTFYPATGRFDGDTNIPGSGTLSVRATDSLGQTTTNTYTYNVGTFTPTSYPGNGNPDGSGRGYHTDDGSYVPGPGDVGGP